MTDKEPREEQAIAASEAPRENGEIQAESAYVAERNEISIEDIAAEVASTVEAGKEQIALKEDATVKEAELMGTTPTAEEKEQIAQVVTEEKQAADEAGKEVVAKYQGEPLLTPDQMQDATDRVLAGIEENPEQYERLYALMKEGGDPKERNQLLEQLVDPSLDQVLQKEAGVQGEAMRAARPGMSAKALFDAMERYKSGKGAQASAPIPKPENLPLDGVRSTTGEAPAGMAISEVLPEKFITAPEAVVAEDVESREAQEDAFGSLGDDEVDEALSGLDGLGAKPADAPGKQEEAPVDDGKRYVILQPLVTETKEHKPADDVAKDANEAAEPRAVSDVEARAVAMREQARILDEEIKATDMSKLASDPEELARYESKVAELDKVQGEADSAEQEARAERYKAMGGALPAEAAAAELAQETEEEVVPSPQPAFEEDKKEEEDATIPSPQPLLEDESEEAAPAPAPAPAEAAPVRVETPEKRLDRQRDAYVDAMDDLNAWFSGKAEGSTMRGRMGNALQKTYDTVNALTKSTWERSPQREARVMVEDIVREMVRTGSSDAVACMDAAGIDVAEIGMDEQSVERIIAAAEAKYTYDGNRIGMFKQEVAKVGRNRATQNRVEDAIDMKKVFDKFVVNEYALQQEYRLEKLDASRSNFSKAMRWVGGYAQKGARLYGKVPLALRLGIGATVGAGIAIGASGMLASAGATVFGGMVAARAVRGIVGYSAGKLAARGVEKLSYSSFKKKDEEAIAQEMTATLAKEGEGQRRREDLADAQTRRKLKEFTALEAAMKDVVTARALEAKIARRKNIAAVMVGMGAGIGTAMLESHLGLHGAVQSQEVAPDKQGGKTIADTLQQKQGPVEQTQVVNKPNAESPDQTATQNTDPSAIKASEQVAQQNPDASVTKPASQNLPKGTEVPKAPDQPAFASNAERMAAGKGFEVSNGGSIWQGVREQVKHYIAHDANARPDQLGVKMTQEQFDALKADLLDGAELSKANQQALDRIIATSITKNQMMTMGIKNPGEVVIWKPGADGGEITFGSGDKGGSLYNMGGRRPVRIDSLPQDNSVRVTTESYTGNGRSTVIEQASADQEGPLPPAGQEWMSGMSQAEVARAQAFFAEFKRQTGIDLDAPESAGDINVRALYQAIPAGSKGTVSFVMNTPGGPKTVVIDERLLRIRDEVVPTEDQMNGTFRNLVKARIATKGIPQVEVAPKAPPEQLVNQAPVPETSNEVVAPAGSAPLPVGRVRMPYGQTTVSPQVVNPVRPPLGNAVPPQESAIPNSPTKP